MRLCWVGILGILLASACSESPSSESDVSPVEVRPAEKPATPDFELPQTSNSSDYALIKLPSRFRLPVKGRYFSSYDYSPSELYQNILFLNLRTKTRHLLKPVGDTLVLGRQFRLGIHRVYELLRIDGGTQKPVLAATTLYVSDEDGRNYRQLSPAGASVWSYEVANLADGTPVLWLKIGATNAPDSAPYEIWIASGNPIQCERLLTFEDIPIATATPVRQP